MRIFFLDTNIFLQCKELKTLPWNDIANGEAELRLMIPRAVQREIDRLKQSGNDRQAKRARKATSFIKKILLSEDSVIPIKEAAPKVEVAIAEPQTMRTGIPAELNLSQPDDSIVAEAIAYGLDHPTHDVIILTHDTNLMGTAKYFHVPFLSTPDEWQLPPEPDPRNKEIRELKEKLNKYERIFPKIELFVDTGERRLTEATFRVSTITYAEPRIDEIQSFLDEVRTKYPMESRSEILELASVTSQLRPSRFDTFRYEPPSDEEIQIYNEEYELWLRIVEERFRSLPSRLELQHRNIPVSVSITNSGSVPAEHVIVEFKLFNGLLFLPPSVEIEPVEPFPRPPKSPEGVWRREAPTYDTLIAAHSELRRPIIIDPKDIESVPDTRYFPSVIPPLLERKPDKHAFYYKPKRPTEFIDYWVFECEEFRHQTDPEVFEMTIHIPSKLVSSKAALRCRVSAKNLPQPFEYWLHMETGFSERDVISEARRLLGG